MGLWGIVEKEFRHIIRDYRTLIILVLFPIIQMTLFGYAMNLEIQKVQIRIDDQDRSEQSRSLIRAFQGSRFFEITDGEKDNLLALFQQRTILTNVTIPPDFSQDILRNNRAEIDVIIDGSNSNSAILIKQYISGTVMNFQSQISLLKIPVLIQPRFNYNPEQKSAYFFVPGIVALLMIMITALLTSLTITREKEKGTMILLRISPLHSYEIIIGKVLPYLVLSMLIAIMIIFLGVVLFGVPILGSLSSLMFYIFIYCLTGLSFGMMISAIASSQQIAMLIALMATLLPTLFLSGFIFPLESMPLLLQWISYAIPAKYFLVIIRGLMLKGNTQADLLFHIGMLLFFSAVFLAVSIKKFTKYLEQ